MQSSTSPLALQRNVIDSGTPQMSRHPGPSGCCHHVAGICSETAKPPCLIMGAQSGRKLRSLIQAGKQHQGGSWGGASIPCLLLWGSQKPSYWSALLGFRMFWLPPPALSPSRFCPRLPGWAWALRTDQDAPFSLVSVAASLGPFRPQQ